MYSCYCDGLYCHTVYTEQVTAVYLKLKLLGYDRVLKNVFGVSEKSWNFL